MRTAVRKNFRTRAVKDIGRPDGTCIVFSIPVGVSGGIPGGRAEDRTVIRNDFRIRANILRIVGIVSAKDIFTLTTLPCILSITVTKTVGTKDAGTAVNSVEGKAKDSKPGITSRKVNSSGTVSDIVRIDRGKRSYAVGRSEKVKVGLLI